MELPQSNDTHEVRILSVVIVPSGEPIFSELATIVSIEDDAGGEFVSVKQDGGDKRHDKSILIDKVEWPMIRDCIEAMVGQCRGM